MAACAYGIADDCLTILYVALMGTLVLAPAMSTNRRSHPGTESNLLLLRERGHVIVEPGEGHLSCGMIGPGRLADPDQIAAAVIAAAIATPLSSSDLEGETVIITAGPTREPLDPVRYISNRSSGKM